MKQERRWLGGGRRRARQHGRPDARGAVAAPRECGARRRGRGSARLGAARAVRRADASCGGARRRVSSGRLGGGGIAEPTGVPVERGHVPRYRPTRQGASAGTRG